MGSYLLCSSPIYGHVAPLVQLGRQLVEGGHTVSMLTGRRYAERVRGAGMGFVALPGEIDYDDADIDAWLPDRDRYSGLRAMRHDMIGMFVRVIPEQHRALADALARLRPGAVVAELAFTGTLPLLLGTPPADRVPVVALSIAPLTLSSRDTAPFGTTLPPAGGSVARLRNRALNVAVARGALGPVQRAMTARLVEVGAPAMPVSFLDVGRLYDRLYHLGLPSLEYPRSDLPDTVRFVGPLGGGRDDVAVPDWWGDLSGRRVVHVSQGTVDSTDMTRLVVPTIRALADDDLLVVATTAGRPLESVLEHFPQGLPGNARLAMMLPYADLLPRCDVMVTNGGFGGVQQALAASVPLVVAGATEDKPEVAARVAWSGVGVDLRTGTPTSARVADGVRRVLGDPAYARAAASYAVDVAAAPSAVARIVDDLALLAGKAGPTARSPRHPRIRG